MTNRRWLVLGTLWLVLAATLACSGGPAGYRDQAVDAAREILADDTISPYDRMVAAGVLYREGDEAGRKYLHGQLVEGSTFIQRAAVSAVFTGRDPEDLAWLERLAASDPELVRQTIEVLRMQPRPGSRRVIEEALLSDNPGTRIAALDAAAATGDPSMQDAVRASLQMPGDSRMFAFGTYALAVLGDPREAAIEKLLVSEFPSDREIAAASLGRIDNEWSLLHLRTLVQDENARVRIAAAASLAELGDEEAVAVLLGFVKGDRDDAAQIGAGALRRIPPQQILAVANDVLRDRDIEAESAARVVEALGWAPGVEARALLEQAVSHSNETMQLQGLWAVGWRGVEREVPLAAAQLGSDNPAVRAMAAWAVVFALDGGFRVPDSIDGASTGA